MESGDEREPSRRGHRARQHGADGMRNGVVDVQQVERCGFENFEHFSGERQRVRRMVKERIGDHLHFVETDAWIVGIHADRRSVADEMNFMATRGELHAELGGHDARAAVRGIASDTDAHRISESLSR